jgi:predicted small lipoprotein YifL
MTGQGRSLLIRGMTILSLTFAFALAACGTKGQPLPPQDVLPQQITDLSASADKDGIRLTWARPETYTSGRTMRDLAGFIVLRAQGNQAMNPLVELPITDRERFHKEPRLDWVDTTTEIGSSYRYAVMSETSDGYKSVPSNTVEFSRLAPPPANPAHSAVPAAPQPSPLP